MNKRVKIICDSACDLPNEMLKKNGIDVIPLHVTIGNTDMLDDGTVGVEHIYNQYEKTKELPKTAAFSIEDAADKYREYTDNGYEIVHIDIGSGLSSCYQNACIAAEEFDEVYVVDSTHLSTGAGLLVLEACKLRDIGMSAKQIADELNNFKTKIQTSFVVDELEFLRAGGRCSNLTALAANMLKLHPCLEMNDGVLKAHKKYKGKINRVYADYVRDKLKEYRVDTSRDIFITSSGGVDEQSTKLLKDIIREELGYTLEDSVDNINITEAGCTIASHCGPGTLGVLFVTE